MDQPRWLSDSEQSAWRKLAGVFTLLPGALDAQLQTDAELSHFEYLVLAMLSESHEHQMRMTELAGIVNGSQSRLSHLVRRLEQHGLVHRRRARDDRRGQVAELTEAGWTKVVASAPGHVRRVRELIFDGLTPEQVTALDEICGAIMARVTSDVDAS